MRKSLLAAILAFAILPASVFARSVTLPNTLYEKGKPFPKSITLETAKVNGFYEYKNARFHFHGLIPASFGNVKLPMNGDGILLSDEDGAELSLSGAYNSMKWELADYIGKDIENAAPDQSSHMTWQEDRYTLSWTKAGRRYYIRRILKEGRTASLHLVFPEIKRDVYEKLIPVMEKDFGIEEETGKK